MIHDHADTCLSESGRYHTEKEETLAYDVNLAERIRLILAGMPGLVEKKMFGGVGFILHGNLACGVHKQALITRIGAEKHQQALANPHARQFDITGRPMAGWVMVSTAGFASEADLRDWVQQGVDFASSLPPK